MWVLGTLAKRWTAAMQPKGFDSPVLLAAVQPTFLVLLTFNFARASLRMLGKRACFEAP